jgi:hypothetical protein
MSPELQAQFVAMAEAHGVDPAEALARAVAAVCEEVENG